MIKSPEPYDLIKPLSVDTLLKSEFNGDAMMITMEQVNTLQTLDVLAQSCEEVVPEVIDLIGVVAGIKPCAIIQTELDLRGHLEDLGLSYQDFNPDRGLCTVSQSPMLAERLRDEFEGAWERGDDLSVHHRAIGQLLGYPETATNYFIKRSPTAYLSFEDQLPIVVPHELKNSVRDNFCGFILSPDNWQDEIASYVEPLERATMAYLPETYSKLLRQARRQKMSNALLKLLGKQQTESYTGFGKVAKVTVYRDK